MNPKNESLDPQLQHDHEILRTDRLRERYGDTSGPWDKEFAGLDTSEERHRAAAQKLKDHLTAAGQDADRPLRFSVSVAGRSLQTTHVSTCRTLMATKKLFRQL
jgi:hypothetical protein